MTRSPIIPALGGSAGLTDATSKTGEPCPKAAPQLKTIRLALKIFRCMKYRPICARKERLHACSTAIKSALMIRLTPGFCDEEVPPEVNCADNPSISD